MAAKARLPATTEDESWIVIDDCPIDNVHELDESVLNPMSARERSVNNFIHGLRRLKQKVSTSTAAEQKPNLKQLNQEPVMVRSRRFFGRLRSKNNSNVSDEAAGIKRAQSQTERLPPPNQQSLQGSEATVTTHTAAFVRTCSLPATVQSGYSREQPQTSSQPTNTASAAVVSKVTKELKAKDKELAALQLKLEMKDQEGHKHKMKAEKLLRQIDQLAENRIQQRISSDKKLEVSRRDGEKKVTQIKHKLQEEQTKSKLREEEMEALKRQVKDLKLQVSQQEGMLECQGELISSMQISNIPGGVTFNQMQPQSPVGNASTVDTMSITIDFPDELIGSLVTGHPVIASVVDDLAKSSGVAVNFYVSDGEDAPGCIKATLSGTQGGVVQVEKEILDLQHRLHIDIETKFQELSCIFAPLLLTANVVRSLNEIEELHLIEISVIQSSKACVFVEVFSSHINQNGEGKPLCVIDLKEFMTPKVPIYINFKWMIKNEKGQLFALSKEINEHLNKFYNTSRGDETRFMMNGEQFIANVSSLEVTDSRTGYKWTLVQESQQPTWSYTIDANTFIDHEVSDSEALESLYRYGGSFIMLAGNKHTLDLNAMQQIDLQTGERVAVQRYPAMYQGAPPEYSITLSVRGIGDSLEAGVKAVQEKLESFLSSCTVTCDFMATVPQEWQAIIAVQIYNAARQYCIRIASFQIASGTLTISLQGAKDVLDKAQIVLKEHCLELQHHVISQVVPQTSILPSNIYPSDWEAQSRDVELFDVQKGTAEWTGIYEGMQKTIPNVDITHVHRIQIRKLWDKYALELKHMSERNSGEVNEYYLYHGTRSADPCTIIVSVRGIDFRYSRRDYQLLWGTGAYFAVNASYSDNYCYINQCLGVKQLLLVRVLTGKSFSYGEKNDPSLTKPPPLSNGNPMLYDTVNGYTNGSYVYVVYDHDRAYPAYLISYLS